MKTTKTMTMMTHNEVIFTQAKEDRPETSQDWLPVLKLSNFLLF